MVWGLVGFVVVMMGAADVVSREEFGQAQVMIQKNASRIMALERQVGKLLAEREADQGDAEVEPMTARMWLANWHAISDSGGTDLQKRIRIEELMEQPIRDFAAVERVTGQGQVVLTLDKDSNVGGITFRTRDMVGDSAILRELGKGDRVMVMGLGAKVTREPCKGGMREMVNMVGVTVGKQQ
jgi:hypothetical protein